MANISKQRREELISKINKIKESIFSLEDDVSKQTLIQYLSDLETEIKGKKYGLVYEKHKENIDEILETNIPVFIEDQSLFVDNGGEMNFLLEGDNLASLNLLVKTHKDKIGVVYIDPPYNTGNEDFIYNDDMVDSTDEYRHSKWLSFMCNRLCLAKKLMKDGSLIFISIDENEYANLKILCDDVFGEINYLTTFDWMKTATPPSLSKTVRRKFEYVLCYKKGQIANSLCGGVVSGGDMPLLNDGNKIIPVKFSKRSLVLKINDGVYKAGCYDRVKLLEDFIVKNGLAVNDLVLEGPMKWTQDTINNEIKNGTLFFIKTNKFAIRYARTGERIKIPSNIISNEECNVGTNEDGAKELLKIFDSKVFSYPKPVSLISYLINMISFYDKSLTVLDFFAGSGTTGHAVLELNKDDGGNRKFILCTNNENNICRDVTYERIKRVIEKENYQASLKYMKVDFVPISEQFYYEYADQLLLHIRELVELENGINFKGNSEIAIILTDEELEEFINSNNDNCKTIYLGHDVLPTGEHLDVINARKIKINIIPDYYYGELGA